MGLLPGVAFICSAMEIARSWRLLTSSVFAVVGPVLNTPDPKVLLQHLAELEVYGGGDCPEMSLSGIKLGLENAGSGSFVYVFTDADAKDAFLFNQILDIAMAKRTPVSN